MLDVIWGSKTILQVAATSNGSLLKQHICKLLCCSDENVYFLHQGKLLHDDDVIHNGILHIIPRMVGGKGGFGSMLRAIGAQIEKTTNREACRDLSGRRLRDINEEKRLKTYINKKVEREKEAQERKIKKLEKLCEMPKQEFVDEEYDKERSDLQEKIEDAVLKGLEVADKQVGIKRKMPIQNINKKKPKLWVDADLDDECSSTTEDESDEPLQADPSISSIVNLECPASTSYSSA